MVRPGCGGCGGIGTCEEVMECWCAQANTDQGLDCTDENAPYVKIGNCLVFGPNGEISIDETCLEQQPAGPCEARVEDLPEFVVIGRGGGSGLTHAYGSPHGIDYAIDNRVPVISSTAYSLVGNYVAAWSPYVGSQGLDYYTSNPATSEGYSVAGWQWNNLYSDAGTNSNPTGRNAHAPDDLKDPDGGWYGFFAPRYYLLTVGAALRRIAGHAVARLEIREENPFTSWEGDVTALLRAVQITCSQASTMVSIPMAGRAQVESINNAQVTAMIKVDPDTSPELVMESGATWVDVDWTDTDEHISSFVSAGLNTIMYTNSRHVQTQRAIDLGCRGIACDDPIYARAPLDAETGFEYRRMTQSWTRRMTEVGELTTQTDDGVIQAGRGFTKESEGGKFYYVTDGRQRSDQLVGPLVPYENPESLILDFEVQCDGAIPDHGGTGLGPRAGLIFGCTTDIDPSGLTEESLAGRDGYWAVILMSGGDAGTLVLGRYDGPDTVELSRSSTAGSVPANEWMTFRVTVAGDTVTFARTDGDGYDVQVADSTYRGEYMSITAGNSSEGDNAWVAGFRSMAVVTTDDQGIMRTDDRSSVSAVPLRDA